MGSTAGDAIEALLVDARFDSAFRAIVALNADVSDDVELRRLAAGVFALAGRERELAGLGGLGFLDCRNLADVDTWCAGLDRASSYDYLIGAIVLSWSSDRHGVYAVLRRAQELAGCEGRPYVEIAACERLAHHALLFGDLETARASLESGFALAATRRLSGWRNRCAARLAELAFDADDHERAAELIEDARALELPPETRMLFAPTAVRLAALRGDTSAAQKWASAQTYALALDSHDADVALPATVTCILAADAHPLSLMHSRALRRGLVLIDSPSNAIEFLALAARVGEPDEARLAADLLRAVFAPQRRYLDAHYRLAQAYVLLRSDDRSGAIDSAGDAARAFDAIGTRRWANEAMLLLVRHDEIVPHVRRRPTTLSLTRREQQVAHLIRRGASNREVAHALQISEHTVERHVSSILSRLGLRSRWQIVDARISGTEH
jgi:DNA-binding CsgD family transcriptional regulator